VNPVKCCKLVVVFSGYAVILWIDLELITPFPLGLTFIHYVSSTLLESIYHEFDVLAKRRRVFKVEMIGDCYVAVCGLPDPRKEHAVMMSRFANDCMRTMHHMTEKLERELGPDTTDLGLRVGLHSGPVVAGYPTYTKATVDHRLGPNAQLLT
jgi:hypothetical protein